MEPQPKSESAQLLEDISVAANNGNMSDFMFHSFKRRADSLRQIDAVAASMALGALACVKYDLEDMHYWHKNAILLAPHHIPVYGNYAVSLEHVFMFKEAYDIAMQGYDIAKDDLHLLNIAIDFAAKGGYFHEANALLDDWHKLSPEVTQHSESLIEGALDLLKEYDIEQDEIVDAIKIASDLFLEKKVLSKSFDMSVAEEEETPYISYKFGIDANPEEVFELEYLLADRLAEPYPPSKGSLFITPTITIG